MHETQDYGGVIYTPLGGGCGSCESTTNLRSGVSRSAPKEPPVGHFEPAPKPTGSLAFVPDGATIRIIYPAAYCRIT